MPRLYIIEQSALVVGGHYHAYTQTVARAARESGLDVTILQNRAFVGDWDVEGANAIPAFEHTWSEADRHWSRDWNFGNIAFDFQRAVRCDPPKAGDHVLFATLGYAELEQLLNYFGNLPPGGDYPFFHLLLRYDPEVLRAQLGAFRPLFDRLSISPMLRRHVLCHSDTHLLAEEFAALTGQPFTLLPIPFQQYRLRERLAEGRLSQGPIVIGYLGDARLEKNYADLPAAVDFLWNDYIRVGRARLVLQSNFNIPGGEPGVLQAVQRLSQYPSDKVRLISTPLDGNAYYDCLADVDIVVIPYDPIRYRVRSSGILVEAKAAGKPIVTTHGSWMSTQVTSEHGILYNGKGQLGSALKEALDNFATLKDGADNIALEMMEWSSGTNFVRALTAATEHRSAIRTGDPHVLIIVDGDTLVNRNGAGQVAITQLTYLRNARYAVTAIFLMNKRNSDVETIEAWTAKLRDSIAEFDFAACFIVGTGRLSFDTLRQQSLRGRAENSIAGDLEQAYAFDAPLALTKHIVRTRFDLVWLNYVMNAPILDMLAIGDVPVICETHDVQSFQKAIYDRRRVDPDEIATEMGILRRFAHLISVSAAETELLQTNIPDVDITTTGIFPAFPPSRLTTLAGLTNLAELVSICVPARPEFTFKSNVQPSGDLAALAELPGIDLLYVSSNHYSNVSGLLWFLTEVYLPLLAPAGTSMVVAGSIADAAEWPKSPGLFFLGRLSDLTPLYAAAKIVVLPVLEGAGVAVKTLEALVQGRPIVATSLALRGIAGDVGGVAVAETPVAFAGAVADLLNSAPLRAERAREALECAFRLASPKRYNESMNGVFSKVLGGLARLVATTPNIETEVPSLEWDKKLRCCNLLIRNWIEERPLDDGALEYLGSLSEEHVAPTLSALCAVLLGNQSASIFASRSDLRSAISFFPKVVREGVSAVLLTAIASFAADERRTAPGASARLLFDGRLPLTIYVRPEGTEAVSAKADGCALDQVGKQGLLVGKVVTAAASASRLSTANIEIAGAGTSGWAVSQRASFDNSHQRWGQPVIPAPAGSVRGLIASAGMSFQLELPTLISPTTGEYWLDLLLGPGLVLEVREAGMTLTGRSAHLERENILRVRIPNSHAGVDAFHRVLTVIATSGAGTIDAMVIRLISSEDPGRMIELVDDHEGVSTTASDPVAGADISFGLSDARNAHQLIETMREGRPLPRKQAIAFRARISEVPGLIANLRSITEAAAEMVGDRGRRTDLLPVLDPGSALAGEKFGYVASAVMTVRIEAEFAALDDADESYCQIDGRATVPIGGEGLRRAWTLAGEHGFRTKNWRHAVRFFGQSGEDLNPDRVQLVFHLPAGRDVITGDRYFCMTNLHGLEREGERMWVWTGPQVESLLVLPLALTVAGTVRLGLASVGDNHADDDLGIAVNGSKLACRRWTENGLIIVEACFDADPQALATTELAIEATKHFAPPADPRRLGISIVYVEFLLSFER